MSALGGKADIAADRAVGCSVAERQPPDGKEAPGGGSSRCVGLFDFGIELYSPPAAPRRDKSKPARRGRWLVISRGPVLYLPDHEDQISALRRCALFSRTRRGRRRILTTSPMAAASPALLKLFTAETGTSSSALAALPLAPPAQGFSRTPWRTLAPALVLASAGAFRPPCRQAAGTLSICRC
jgi:hypothetical protein